MGIEIKEEEWFRMKSCVESMDKLVNGNGKPPLWERMKEYVDSRDAHKERNMQQEVMDLRHEINTRHDENKKVSEKHSEKLDTLMRLVYIGLGIVIALESVGIFKK